MTHRAPLVLEQVEIEILGGVEVLVDELLRSELQAADAEVAAHGLARGHHRRPVELLHPVLVGVLGRAERDDQLRSGPWSRQSAMRRCNAGQEGFGSTRKDR